MHGGIELPQALASVNGVSERRRARSDAPYPTIRVQVGGAVLCTPCQFSTGSAKPMVQQCRQATHQRPSQALLEKKPVKRWQAKVLLPRAQAKSAGRLASS